MCHAVGTSAEYYLSMSESEPSTCARRECTATISTRNTKFCSRACRYSADFSKREQQLLDGEYPPVTNATRFLQRFLRLRYGERCTRCGWDERHEITGRVPLEVEHRDGNWRNNRLENLTLLCPNCHSLTRTFRNLKRGNGRPGRRGGRSREPKVAE